MATQLCPVCGCTIDDKAHEKEGVTYCCQPCAEGVSEQCSCGCCEISEEQK
ncbi:hypothetical protein ACFLU1_04330 [Chloroflexota bacterium]